MTTTPVMSITDEQIAEIEADGCYPTSDEFRAIISRLRAAEKDAERYQRLLEALENSRRAMFAVLKQETKLKAVARRVLSTEIERIDTVMEQSK